MQTKKLLTAIVSIAGVTWWVLPRNNATKLIEAQSQAMSGMIRVALGTSPVAAPVKDSAESKSLSLRKAASIYSDEWWLSDPCLCGCQDDDDYQYPGLHGMESRGLGE